MSYFPMMVDLDKKKVLVVGGGNEGTQKINVLKPFGCDITLISIEASPEAAAGADVYIQRAFEDTDIDEKYVLIVAATGDLNTDEKISKLAKNKKIPVNVVDKTELCTFIFPAIVKDKDVVIGVSSGGKSPYLVQFIKQLILSHLPKNIGEINDKMGDYRVYAKENINDAKERRRFLKEKLDFLLGYKSN
ncbi:MAG: bifunctional precorrin-2 dehydrogenase/sirohydrochlorin ferrochelatase [Lachnospiraceae bacterium]|nr:bifunctional precorrin-2 dehydrogenase/sirohydrochlorin ferrochelatase [Lachnospiraceae bacterium]